jgi:hypothetical protein
VPLTPEAKKLLRRVQKHIKEEPRRWSWGFGFPSEDSPCGMRACIGGWVNLLSYQDKQKTLTIERHEIYNAIGCSKDAQANLGIDGDEAYRLFFSWPQPFANDLSAGSAVKRIDLFIKTNGTDILPVKTPHNKTQRKSKKTKDLPAATT